MRNKLLVILLLFSSLSGDIDAQDFGKRPTFKGYRLLFSAGVSPSLTSLLVSKNHRLALPERIIPSIGAEIVLNGHKSLKLEVGQHLYTYKAEGATSYSFNSEVYQTNINAQVRSIALSYRRYSQNILSIAPQGRFISYGFSLNTASFSHSGYSFKDDYFNATRKYLPETLKVENFVGFRVESGRKFFIGRALRHAVEVSFLAEMFLLKYPSDIGFKKDIPSGNLNAGLVAKGMKYSYVNSMLQLKISYAIPIF